jgi:hypothetical protein
VGGIFDGRYLYLVPYSNNLVLRFEAAAGGTPPAQSGASFY